MDFDAVFNRHERIALHFSGGRDSLAVLHLLQPHWGRMTVYWCNSGDVYPEVVDLMRHYAAILPRFVEVAGRQPQVVAQFGIPSDVVPITNTADGLRATNQTGPLIQDRFSCCARSIMMPMHERMVADQITLLIRGQRENDLVKAPTRSGDVIDGFELFFPIEHWTSQQVNDYLMHQGVPLPSFYESMQETPDCKTCSAYWHTNHSAYRAKHNPEAHGIAQARLDAINGAMHEHIIAFNREVSA